MTAVKETRKLQMHERLLYDVIRRQAGTLEKAMLEAAMNAADAGATKCEFILGNDKLTIVDDGKGFRSRDEIEKFFETFGQPPEEGEKKTYGYFRMGRGQLFSFGDNVWISGCFRMEVDIKNKGLSYDLTTLAEEKHSGCRIEIRLYEPLTETRKLHVVRSFPRYVKYMSLNVTLNGERACVDPSEEKWTHVTDEAFISLKSSQMLSVYNQGAWVADIYDYKMGTGGVVVSKKPLKVNFARNDIMSDCPVWRKIKAVVQKNAVDRNAKKTTLTQGEMQAAAEQIICGEIDPEKAGKMNLFQDVCGRCWSAEKIVRAISRYNYKIASAEKYDARGDRVHQSKIAFVVANATLEMFECGSGPNGVKKLMKIVSSLQKYDTNWWLKEMSYPTMDDIAGSVSESCEIVDPKKHRPTEKAWLSILQSGCGYYIMQGLGREGASERTLVIGDSGGKYLGWTDGESFIAIDRKFLAGLRFDMKGLMRAYEVLLHEYCHEGPDSETHSHSQEFYQKFHDNIGRMIDMALRAWTALPSVLAKANIKMGLATAREMDKAKAAEKVLAEHEKAAKVA